ncbi:MAG: 50S ribosomal protein L6 [Alphaproteobacteria bacterium]|nr:50S ribosomal protein L6 [Alphaproteobacteria bacterium]MDD9919522.1 50S ribosomal protein L6 [Alphaproteobacteria bacterium]
MSRIGKAPVAIPQGVEVALNGRKIRVKGPKGELSWDLPHDITASVADNQVALTVAQEQKRYRAMWGTSRALIANMVTGVTEGYNIPLKLIGVGYRANMQGNKLVLNVGYSHPVEMELPAGVSAVVTENTDVAISGIDKQKVGEFAANVRRVRPPEPFKGKGIRYANEYIAMKEGKKK